MKKGLEVSRESVGEGSRLQKDALNYFMTEMFYAFLAFLFMAEWQRSN